MNIFLCFLFLSFGSLIEWHDPITKRQILLYEFSLYLFWSVYYFYFYLFLFTLTQYVHFFPSIVFAARAVQLGRLSERNFLHRSVAHLFQTGKWSNIIKSTAWKKPWSSCCFIVKNVVSFDNVSAYSSGVCWIFSRKHANSSWRWLKVPLCPSAVQTPPLQWLQSRYETGGAGPSQLQLCVHRHGDGHDGYPFTPAPGRQRQHQRLLEAGGLLGHPADRNVWAERRHAAAAPGWASSAWQRRYISADSGDEQNVMHLQCCLTCALIVCSRIAK